MHLSKNINNKAVFGRQKSVEAMARGKVKMPVNYLFFKWKLGFVKLNNLNANVKVDLTLVLITFIHGFCHIIPKRTCTSYLILLISWFQLFRSTLHLLDAEGSCTTPDLHSADEMCGNQVLYWWQLLFCWCGIQHWILNTNCFNWLFLGTRFIVGSAASSTVTQ